MNLQHNFRVNNGNKNISFQIIILNIMNSPYENIHERDVKKFTS